MKFNLNRLKKNIKKNYNLKELRGDISFIISSFALLVIIAIDIKLNLKIALLIFSVGVILRYYKKDVQRKILEKQLEKKFKNKAIEIEVLKTFIHSTEQLIIAMSAIAVSLYITYRQDTTAYISFLLSAFLLSAMIFSLLYHAGIYERRMLYLYKELDKHSKPS